MKRFISLVLIATTIFIGIGAVVDRAGAAFRSDERAVAIINRARVAIGGDNVRSLTISAKTVKSLDFPEGAKSIDGNLDIALELPNRLSKSIRAGNGPDGAMQDVKIISRVSTAEIPEGAAKVVVRTDGQPTSGDVKVVVMEQKDGQVVTTDGTADRKVIVRSTDGQPMSDANVMVFETKDGQTITSNAPNAKRVMISKMETSDVVGAAHGDELLRLTLSLLARAPEGRDIAFSYAGESSVDGNSCDLVTAGTGDAAVTLCFDRSSGLPRSMTYKAPKPFIIKLDKQSKPGEDVKVTVNAERQAPELADYVVKFSDYRNVDGVMLPFSWTQTVSGKSDESVTVSSYAINPPDIADKFKNEGNQMFVFKKKEGSK